MPKGLILVVAAETALQDMLDFHLKGAGYHVLRAADAPTALTAVKHFGPELALVDARLPGLPAGELCAQLQAQAPARDLHRLVLGGEAEAASWADGHLATPPLATELLAQVAQAFQIIHLKQALRAQRQELARYQAQVQDGLALASALQLGLLPKLPGQLGGLRYTHRYLPAAGLGGDIYAVKELPGGGTALLVADVSGHGVSAALISALVKAAFDHQVSRGGGPLDWAHGMNEDLCRSTLPEQFATAWLGLLEPAQDRLQFVGAGHCAPFRVVGATGGGLRRSEVLRSKGLPLGVEAAPAYQAQETPFLVGDRLVLYTDGLVEVERSDRSLLDQAGFRRICAELPADLEAAADAALAEAHAAGAADGFSDDVTLVLLDRLA